MDILAVAYISSSKTLSLLRLVYFSNTTVPYAVSEFELVRYNWGDDTLE
jgi:hypothetical protein